MKPQQQITHRVALYIRVSTEEQVDRYGIDLQKEALLSIIKHRPKLEDGQSSFELAGEQYIYIDEGVSGTVKLDERPAFARLKEDILYAPEGQKPFDVVAVYKIDRFARQLRILLDVIDFFGDQDIQFISANESIDTSTAFGKAMLGIIGIIAELERDTILQRTRDGRIQAFEAGTVMGKSAPYGYSKDENKKYKILEPEAEIVREIFRMFIEENRSINYIARYLTDHEILSPASSAIKHKKLKGEVRRSSEIYFWRDERVRYILNDDIYTGKNYTNKMVRNKPIPRDQWILSTTPTPTIIDIVTFEKARKLLSDNKRQKHVAKDGHIYLLSGLLRCDCCYNPEKDKNNNGRIGWHGERKNKNGVISHYYKCTNKNKSKSLVLCKSLPFSGEEVENYLIDFIRKLLKSPVAVFNHQKRLQSAQNTVKHLQRKENSLIGLIDAIPLRKKNLREQQQINVIDTPTLQKEFNLLESKQRQYQNELMEVRRQMAENTLSKGYSDSLEAFSEHYKSALKNSFKKRPVLYTIIHQLIEEIVVYCRPVTSTDIVAGIRRSDQQMPSRLHIKLKLPQDILNQIGKQEVFLEDFIPDSKGSSGQKSVFGAP
ncbi:MAG: recombinase family protein [Minisyncoccia bacterium]